MDIGDLHPWPENYRQAVLQQDLLAAGVCSKNDLQTLIACPELSCTELAEVAEGGIHR